MTKEQFDLKYRGEKVAVHCDTEEKAKAFLSLAKSFGYKWVDAYNDELEITYWSAHREQTCYTIDEDNDVMTANIGWYKDKGYTILEFELDEPKETFNVGDLVYQNGYANPLIILRKAWVVCYADKKEYEHFVDERYLTHKTPLKEITEKELADMGFVLKK